MEIEEIQWKYVFLVRNFD
ncbi:hypothetical protein AX774_g2829, partial [Zancudomyces culisetae]